MYICVCMCINKIGSSADVGALTIINTVKCKRKPYSQDLLTVLLWFYTELSIWE